MFDLFNGWIDPEIINEGGSVSSDFTPIPNDWVLMRLDDVWFSMNKKLQDRIRFLVKDIVCMVRIVEGELHPEDGVVKINKIWDSLEGILHIWRSAWAFFGGS